MNQETTWQIHFALGLVDIRKTGDKRVKCCETHLTTADVLIINQQVNCTVISFIDYMNREIFDATYKLFFPSAIIIYFLHYTLTCIYLKLLVTNFSH